MPILCLGIHLISSELATARTEKLFSKPLLAGQCSELSRSLMVLHLLVRCSLGKHSLGLAHPTSDPAITQFQLGVVPLLDSAWPANPLDPDLHQRRLLTLYPLPKLPLGMQGLGPLTWPERSLAPRRGRGIPEGGPTLFLALEDWALPGVCMHDSLAPHPQPPKVSPQGVGEQEGGSLRQNLRTLFPMPPASQPSAQG